jgi:hypothetical protein
MMTCYSVIFLYLLQQWPLLTYSQTVSLDDSHLRFSFFFWFKGEKFKFP